MIAGFVPSFSRRTFLPWLVIISRLGLCPLGGAKGLKQGLLVVIPPANATFSQQEVVGAAAQRNNAGSFFVLAESSENTGSSLSNLALFKTETPDRKLSAAQVAALSAAISAKSCSRDDWKGTSDLSGWVEVLWVSGEESAGYAADFISAFGGMDAKDAGTCGRFAFASEVSHSGRMKGVLLVAPDWEHPSRIALLIRKALDNTHIHYVAVAQKQIPPSGLSKFGVAILIGTK